MVVAEKGRAFEEWLQRREWDLYGRYCAQRAVVQQAGSKKDGRLAMVLAIGE